MIGERVVRAVLVAALLPALAGVAPARAAGAQAEEWVAVPAPRVVMTGTVLMKDGVTPVRSELLLTGLHDGETYRAGAGRKGRYKVKVPIGQYRLQIRKGMELYTSPSVYRLPAGQALGMDFLILPDFEKDNGEAAAAPFSSKGLPAPRVEQPRPMGTVVDLAPEAGRRRAKRSWRWAETLGFLGTVLAVGLAAN